MVLDIQQGWRPTGILLFSDRGQLHIYDGHHRCVALLLAGVKELLPEQYSVQAQKVRSRIPLTTLLKCFLQT